MLTWIVNRDREQLRGGAAQATKPGTKTFPYFAAPNTAIQSVVERIDLKAGPDKVWALIGQFGGYWHPLIADIKLIGSGVGTLRVTRVAFVIEGWDTFNEKSVAQEVWLRLDRSWRAAWR